MRILDAALRHLSSQIGLGVADGLERSGEGMEEGARAKIMARGFVQGIDEQLVASRAPERAVELVRVIGAEARATLVVLGGCVAMTLGVAMLARAVARR